VGTWVKEMTGKSVVVEEQEGWRGRGSWEIEGPVWGLYGDCGAKPPHERE